MLSLTKNHTLLKTFSYVVVFLTPVLNVFLHLEKYGIGGSDVALVFGALLWYMVPVPLLLQSWNGLLELLRFQGTQREYAWAWVTTTAYGVGSLTWVSGIYSTPLLATLFLVSAFVFAFNLQKLVFWSKEARYEKEHGREIHLQESTPETSLGIDQKSPERSFFSVYASISKGASAVLVFWFVVTGTVYVVFDAIMVFFR